MHIAQTWIALQTEKSPMHMKNSVCRFIPNNLALIRNPSWFIMRLMWLDRGMYGFRPRLATFTTMRPLEPGPCSTLRTHCTTSQDIHSKTNLHRMLCWHCMAGCNYQMYAIIVNFEIARVTMNDGIGECWRQLLLFSDILT